MVVVGAWAMALALGFRVLVTYEVKAGTAALAPNAWVNGTGLQLDPTRANLIMFAHPQCPCSRATMAELDAIMVRVDGRLRATVCFLDPEGEEQAWTESALWRKAASIPGVEVIADHNGAIAAQFGSATSGQVFLFDGAGKRLFAGGITGARGHQGENRGRNYVVALARGELCSPTDTPVFGCSLHDPQPDALATP
jgi:hypothetical protein